MLKKSKHIRVFFALPIPQDRAAAFRKLIIQKHPKIEHHVKWVKPGNHHVTVQFLGNVAEQKIPLITAAVEKALAFTKPFNVVLRHIVPFPNREGHTVAVSIQPSLALQNLYDAIGLAMTSGKLPSEKRVYNPHITMFRASNNFKMAFNSISH